MRRVAIKSAGWTCTAVPGTSGDVGNFRTVVASAETWKLLSTLLRFIRLPRSAKNPQAVIDVNVGGTGNLLDAAAASGVRRFVYLSTAKIYGEPARMPSRESDPLCPLDPYATSKLAAEERCRELHLSHGLEVAMVRPFSVYGAGQDLDTGYVGCCLRPFVMAWTQSFPGNLTFSAISCISTICYSCCQTASSSHWTGSPSSTLLPGDHIPCAPWLMTSATFRAARLMPAFAILRQILFAAVAETLATPMNYLAISRSEV